MSLELKKQIHNFLDEKQSANEMYEMYCKISKRKDLQRQVKRFGLKSYNVRLVKTAVLKFIRLNPKYDPAQDQPEIVNVIVENSGSGMITEKPQNNQIHTDTGIVVKQEKTTAQDSGSAMLTEKNTEVAETKKKYPKKDIIVQIKKRLADISNERSFLQNEILKIGTGNDKESISKRKKLLDKIKSYGDEYDVLFKAKEDFFVTGILPDANILKIKGSEKITILQAVKLRNNLRSQISRLKNKNKNSTEELSADDKMKLSNLQTEHDKYQTIIDNAS